MDKKKKSPIDSIPKTDTVGEREGDSNVRRMPSEQLCDFRFFRMRAGRGRTVASSSTSASQLHSRGGFPAVRDHPNQSKRFRNLLQLAFAPHLSDKWDKCGNLTRVSMRQNVNLSLVVVSLTLWRKT